jgi:hypothetical protein
MPLSDAKIRTLKPNDKAYKVSDFEGLFLTVKPTGPRLQHFKYRIAGKEKLLSLGIYPGVGLSQARHARDAARILLAAGEDPSAAKQERKREERERREHTFEFFAAAYQTKISKEGKAAATLAKTEWLLGIAKAEFGNEPIFKITSPLVVRCLRKIEAKGNYETAKRLRAVIGAVFRYAIANGSAEIDPTWALRDALIRRARGCREWGARLTRCLLQAEAATR